MTLSRRELLRLAGGAAAGTGLAAIAAACGSGDKGRRPTGPRRQQSLRARLRELVDELETAYPIATALALDGWRGAAAADPGESSADQRPVHTVRFEVFDGASWFSQVVDSTHPDLLAAAVSSLRARAPSAAKRGERPTRDAEPRDFYRRGEKDVRRLGPLSWLERAETLRAQTESPTTSRIIYRGGFVAVDDVETLFVGAGQDLRQSISRIHAGVLLMSWNGIEMVVEEASRGGTGGLELAALDDAAISAAVRRALALSAGPPSGGRDLEVVLDPSVVAALFSRGVVDQLDGRRWQSGESRMADFADDQVADNRISLVDDPTLDGGYGSYDFDDEGWLSGRRPLIHQGVVLGPFTDRRTAAAIGRGRTGHARFGEGGMAPRPSNVLVSAGGATRGELIKSVKLGYLLEGALLARCDPLRWRVLIRARRAREIRDGSESGRVLGPASVRADVKSLLLGVRGATAKTELVHLGPATSIAAPYLLTRAEVSA